MINAIRGLPDLPMLLVMFIVGTVMWIAIIAIVLLWSRFKETMACRYIALKHENTRLRKRLQRLHEVNIRGSIKEKQ